MKKYYVILGCLELFTAIGAIPAGLGFLTDTTGARMGTSTAMLGHSPFSSFLIPGLFLLIVNGFGQGFAAFLSFKKKEIAGIAGLVAGLVLVLWIIIQVYMIGLSHFLQPVFFITGILEGTLGYYILTSTNKAV